MRASPLLSRVVRFVLAATFFVWTAAPGASQADPRFGVGFDVVTALYGQDVIPNGPSVGFRGRIALPINADLSLSASLGAGSHVFEGGENTIVLNPQAELVVMLPQRRRSENLRYLLGGFGGYIPVRNGDGGLSIHAGAGLAIPLRETSLFLELNPALALGDDATVPVVSARAGVIF